MKKRLGSLLLCLCMVLCILPGVSAAQGTITAGGWNETIWAEISGFTDAQITGVQYSGTVSGSLSGQDLQYLVRDVDGGVRIDIPGLPAGTYQLTVTTSAGTLTQSDIQVPAQDRSGYAHFNYTAGVGAYNDDGSLKSGAIVLYVTEDNKNTVSVTAKDGTTVTGIGNILNSVGQDVGGGSNSKGGKANTNKDILRKLAAEGTPLVVRIIGNVTAPDGLTAYNGVDYGGSKGDNGFMARMSGGKNITIEGVGVGAVINGWGLHFICQTADYANGFGKSFEVRNLTFRNVPEDCVGMEGQQEGSTLTAPVERCWIHNCAFYGPTIANPAESDKDGGDGACDFKRGQYFTNSYCYYEGYHKTNLVGSSDSSLQYHMTYHHNYWKDCESRGPLARQANIHMYNNIFEGQRSYCMNPRANAYIFSEYNLFVNCKNPVRVKLGAVKSYEDSFINCTGDNHATRVTDKATKVDTNCKYANFDTNASQSYIPTGDYLLHADIEEVKQVVVEQAGPQGGGVHAELPDTGGDSGGESGGEGGGNMDIPAGSYVHNFTENAMESDFFAISGNLSTSKGSVTFDGLTLTRCLKIETVTSITFTAPESGKLVLVFGGSTNAAGKTIKIDGVKQTIGSDNILTVTVAAGSHAITKGDSINLFYMAYTSDSVGSHTHSYIWELTAAPTCTEPGQRVYTCQCGDSYPESIDALGHDLTEWIKAPGGGQQWRQCQRCDYEEYEELPPCSHENVQWDEGIDPTCTQAGRGPNGLCRDCGVFVGVGEEIPARGHTYETEEVLPTCGKDGYRNSVCANCGHLQPEVLPATGMHTYGEPARENGMLIYTCSGCGYSYTEEDSPEPTNPAEPTNPTNPTNPTVPAPTDPAPTQPDAPDAPDQTGEAEPNGAWWLLLLAVPVAAVAVILLWRKKK